MKKDAPELWHWRDRVKRIKDPKAQRCSDKGPESRGKLMAELNLTSRFQFSALSPLSSLSHPKGLAGLPSFSLRGFAGRNTQQVWAPSPSPVDDGGTSALTLGSRRALEDVWE